MRHRSTAIVRKMLLAGIALCVSAAQARAQDAGTTAAPTAAVATAPPANQLEEITVTARKRAENLERTPISITAVTSAELASRGITSISRIQDFTPNLTYANVPSNSGITSNAAVYIRGIGQNDFAPGVDPGVGIYLDGVYLGTPVGSVFDMIDVQRVEVLRGPQGTLFGRNTIGGAVSVTTIQPSDTFALKADAKYGTDNRVNLRVFANVPLQDNLFVKLSGGLFRQDGYVNAPFQGRKLGNQDTKTIRGAVRWLPASNFDVTLSGDYTNDKSNGVPGVITGINSADTGSLVTLNNAIAVGNPALCFTPANAANTACYNQRLYSRTTNYGTDPDFSRLHAWSATLDAKWNIAPNTQLRSISAYRKTTAAFAQDRDSSNLGIMFLLDNYQEKQFSEELQLTGKALDGKLDYAAGVYYLNSKGYDRNPVVFLILSEESDNYFDYSSYAAYTQATYHFTPKLSLTAGVRYTKDNKAFTPDQFYVSSLAPFLVIPPGTRIVPEQKYTNDAGKWTPMADLAYQFTDSLMGYLTYSQGYKGGGFTQRLTNPEASLPTFRPETVTNYEAGFKFSGLGNRLRVNAAGFHMVYNDVQLLVADATRIGPFYTNAGKAHIDGFEFETQVAPGDGWHLSASAGLTDAGFVSLANTVQGLNLDSKFVFVSKWTLSGSIEKQIELGKLGTLTPRGDWTYRSGFYTNANGINYPELYQPGYSVFNASLRWLSDDKRYNLTVGGDNLGNDKFRTSGNYQPAFGFFMQSFDRGRQVYVQAGLAF